jgi:hypothetical protein
MKSTTTLDEPIIFSTQYKHHYIRKDEPYCTECILKFMGKNGNIFVCYGYSIASEGRPFNRKIGRTIALGRAEKLVSLLWNHMLYIADEFVQKQKIRDDNEMYYSFSNYERLEFFKENIGNYKADYEELTPDEFEQEHSAMVALS